MKKLLAALMLLATPALAQPMQFDSAPSPSAAPSIEATSPGLAWLQRKPMTLFDLGMMELTQAANKAAEGMFDVGGGVAEYIPDQGLIAISFYASTAYSQQNCGFVLKKLRDTMFQKRDDKAALARELASYFISYGPQDPAKPANIGAELLASTRVVGYMPGGMCQMSLVDDEIRYWKDPNAPEPTLPPAATEAAKPAPAAPAPAKPAATAPARPTPTKPAH